MISQRSHNFPSKGFWLWPGLYIAILIFFHLTFLVQPCEDGFMIGGCGIMYDITLTLVLQASIVYFLIAIPLHISEKRGNKVHGFMYFLVGFLASGVSMPLLILTKGALLTLLMEFSG